jgi:AraC-like DNA-binding protein
MGRGVLRPDLAAAHITLDRHQPSAVLAPFVDYYWIPRWDLRGEPAYEQAVLPHPNVHLVFEASGAGIFGVDRRLFTRSLSGLGMAFGVRFRAGCFRPFWQAPISQLTDRVIPAVRLFGSQAEKTRQAIMRAGGSLADDDARMVGYAEALLCSVRPERDPVAEQVAVLVSRITDDPGLRRVDELSAASGLSARTLQRLFADYVGVSPKWVMRRARLHEAAERADSGEPVDWAALAADLGYADQAHLTRDFTVAIGVPPSRYAAPAKDPLTALPAGVVRWRCPRCPRPNPEDPPHSCPGTGGRGAVAGLWGRMRPVVCVVWRLGWRGGSGFYYYGDDHGAAAVVVADPFADDAAG